VKEVFFFCVALVYQNQPHSSTHAGFTDDMLAASFAVRKSKAISSVSTTAGSQELHGD
jgi:hypothetical protein